LDEFRQDAVRIALSSGLMHRPITDNFGVGMSTLNQWITAYRDIDVVSKEDLSHANDNDRLRNEIRLLKEERDILKKATQFFARQKPSGCRALRRMFSTTVLAASFDVVA